MLTTTRSPSALAKVQKAILFRAQKGEVSSNMLAHEIYLFSLLSETNLSHWVMVVVLLIVWFVFLPFFTQLCILL